MPALSYDAFISYRRVDGERHARKLRRALIDFRFPSAFADAPQRPLAIYLDTIYEQATEDFFENTIKPALKESKHLIVVRTPATLERRSDGEANWLEREIAFFRTLPQGRNISVALAQGNVDDPLPGDLSHHLPNIEVVDMRAITRLWLPAATADELLKFIAPLHSIPQQHMPELRAEEARRRATRMRRLAAGAATLTVLLASLTVWAFLSRAAARAAEVRANDERRIAVARQLAAEAALIRLQSGRQLERSVLLAIESYLRQPTLEGEQALRGSTSLLVRRVASRDGEAHVDTYTMTRDARVAAAAPFGGVVTFRDTLTGTVIGTLPEAIEAHDLSFSPDSRLVATRSRDGVVTIWPSSGDSRNAKATAKASEDKRREGVRESRLSAEQRLRLLRSHNMLIASCIVPGVGEIAVSSSGIVAGTDDERVHVVDCRTGQTLYSVQHADHVDALAFDAAARLLATASWDGEARVWDAHNGTLRQRLFHNGFVIAVAFSDDGELLATASQDKTARIWESNTWRERLRIRHDLPLRGIEISPAGDMLVTLSDDLTARVWDSASGRELARMPQDGSGLGAAFHANGRFLVTWDYGGTVNTWDLWTRSRDAHRARLRGSVGDLTFRGDDLLTTIVRNKELAILDATTLRPAFHLRNPFIRPVAISADGLVSAVTVGAGGFGEKRSTHVVNAAGIAREIAECAEPVAVSSSTLVCRTREVRRTEVVSAHSGRVLFRVSTSSQLNGASFSGDGRRLALASFDSITVHSIPDGVVIAKLDNASHGNLVALNHDGKMLATEAASDRVVVRDLSSGRVMATVDHDGRVAAIRFGPFSDVIATASDDRFARVVRLSDGAYRARIPHDDRVVALAFDTSGRRLATATFAGEIAVWNWSPEDLIERGCGLLTRSALTVPEWQRYIGAEVFRQTCR